MIQTWWLFPGYVWCVTSVQCNPEKDETTNPCLTVNWNSDLNFLRLCEGCYNGMKPTLCEQNRAHSDHYCENCLLWIRHCRTPLKNAPVKAPTIQHHSSSPLQTGSKMLGNLQAQWRLGLLPELVEENVARNRTISGYIDTARLSVLIAPLKSSHWWWLRIIIRWGQLL